MGIRDLTGVEQLPPDSGGSTGLEPLLHFLKWALRCVGIAVIVLFALPIDSPAPNEDFLPSVNGSPWLWPTREVRDRAYLLALLIGSVSLVFSIKRSRLGRESRARSTSYVWPIAALLLIVQGGLWADRRLAASSYFIGFTPIQITVITLAVIAGYVSFTTKFGHNLLLSRRVEATIVLGLASFASFRMFGAIKSIWDVEDPYHTTFLMNEFLAGSSGKIPLWNFVPQYTGLLSWPLSIVISLFKADPLNAAFVYVAFFNLTTLALVLIGSLAITRKMGRSVWIASWYVAGAVVAPGDGSYSSFSYWAQNPVRNMNLGVAMVSIGALLRLDRSQHRIWVTVVVSIVAIGINLESGLALALATLIVLVSTASGVTRRREFTTVLLVLGAVTGVLSLIKEPSSGKSIASSLSEFVRIFGGAGFYNVPALPLGTHHTMAASILVFMTLGGWAAERHRGRHLHTSRSLVGISMYGMIMFTYFGGRSYAALLTSVFPALAVSAALSILLLKDIAQEPDLEMTRGTRIAFLTVMLFAAVPSSFIAMNHSGPKEDTETTSLASDFGQLSESAVDVLSQLASEVDDPAKVGLVSELSTLHARQFGFSNAVAYNSPSSIVTKAQYERQCLSLIDDDLEVLAIYPQGALEAWYPIAECAFFPFRGSSTQA